MSAAPSLKPLIWVGASRKSLREFPDQVQDHMGFALYVAQRGGKHGDVKTLSGFGGAGILEVIKDFRGDTLSALHRALCRGVIRPSRLPEEIENRARDAAP